MTMPTRARAIVYAIAFVGLLAGLFAMHGMAHPGGCHGAHKSSTMQSGGDHLDHVVAQAVESGQPDAASVMTQGAAADCVATPPRTMTKPLAGVGPVAVVAVVAGLRAPSTPVRRRDGSVHNSRRAPPLWGIGLLQHACVSRT